MKNRGKKSGKMSVTYDSVNVTLVILLWRDGEKLHQGHVSSSERVRLRENEILSFILCTVKRVSAARSSTQSNAVIQFKN